MAYYTNAGLTRWSILHGGLPSFCLRQHYSITPAQPTSAHASPPQSRSRSSSAGAPIHSGHHVVSDSTKLCLSPPLLSSLDGADLPFLHTIFKVVLTIWSQSSRYEFNVILAPQWRSSSFFPGTNASEKIASSTHGRWGEFTVILGFGRGNIEGKSGE